jgi:pyruvate ferredoxin oxidoreductase beta subunit
VIEGKWRLTRKITKPKPVTEYLKMQRRFRHLTDEDIAFIQQRVDEDYQKLLALCGEEPPKPES